MQSLTRCVDDLAAFAARGGSLRPGSRIIGVRCVDCGHAMLYDEVADRLFVDPSDLRRVVQGIEADEARACPACARVDWSIEDIPADESDALEAGPWGFCFWQPPPARVTSPLRRAMGVVGLAALASLGIASLAANPDPLANPGPGDFDLDAREGP